ATAFSGSVTVALGANPGGGTLAGTATVTAAGGVATFSGLSVNKAGSGYTLTAAATGLRTSTSAPFTITVGALAQLAFTVQPTNVVAGATIAPAVQVTGQDAQGNTVTAFSGNVTVAIGSNPGGGTLAGTTTVAAVSGVATFPGLSINKVGSAYTLTAGAAGLTQTSAAFTPAVQVTAQDALGNTATAFGGSVTVAIGTNPGGGTLSGTTSLNAVNGVATFAGLNINRAGAGYTLAASASGLGTAPSPAFNVTAGAATQLVFTVEPSATVAGAAITPAVQVTAQDALGNTDPSFTGQVTVALGANPGNGALSGTTTGPAVAGVTTFPGLSIDRAAAGYTLTAGATGLPVATSAVFSVSAGATNHLAFTVEPSNATSGTPITPAVQVTALDALGNTAQAFTGNVTVALGTNPGSA